MILGVLWDFSRLLCYSLPWCLISFSSFEGWPILELITRMPTSSSSTNTITYSHPYLLFLSFPSMINFFSGILSPKFWFLLVSFFLLFCLFTKHGEEDGYRIHTRSLIKILVNRAKLRASSSWWAWAELGKTRLVAIPTCRASLYALSWVPSTIELLQLYESIMWLTVSPIAFI